MPHDCTAKNNVCKAGQRLRGKVFLARRRAARLSRILACWVTTVKGGDANVAKRVVSFLPSHHDVMERFLPVYNRWGIRVIPAPSLGTVDPWTADMLVDDRNLNRLA